MNAIMEPTQFTDLESEEIVAYRPVNRWAILSTLFGLLAPTALVHPSLLVFPVAGLVCAALAARHLQRADGAQTGRGALIAGLVLSILFGCCATTAFAYRQYYFNSTAQACADRWFALVREGKLREAHQMTLDDDQRVNPGQSFDAFYAEPTQNGKQGSGDDGHGHDGHNHRDIDEMDPIAMMEATPSEKLHMFLEKPVIIRMKALGNSVEYKFVRTVSQTPNMSTGMYVEQLYSASFEEDGVPQQLLVKIVLERTLMNRVGTWKVASVEEATAS
ncbi:MAG: hypothetical protein AB7F89_20660 [Pirellulaceae bacterium]